MDARKGAEHEAKRTGLTALNRFDSRLGRCAASLLLLLLSCSILTRFLTFLHSNSSSGHRRQAGSAQAESEQHEECSGRAVERDTRQAEFGD